MGKIALEGMKFRAYHGLYEEERKNGNSFIVDVELEVDFNTAAINDDINQTVDYEEVYKIAKSALEGSSYLLEHLAHKILEALYDKFSTLIHAKVRVSKLNPPVGGECERAAVTIEK